MPGDFRGIHLTSEARAAVGGILVALMFLTFVVIRLDPSGRSAAGGMTAVSARTLQAYWVIAPGQTFSVIAERTGLSVAQIEDLNPYVDPAALVVGSRIRLRPAAPSAAGAAKSTSGH